MDILECCGNADEEDAGPRVIDPIDPNGMGGANGIVHVDNSIRTAKYTLLTLIPQGLFEQFRRVANVFFAAISVLMIIGEYSSLFESPITAWTTLGPLTFILGATLVKEALEDHKRHQADAETNSRKAAVLQSTGDCVDKEWQEIRVGMIVKVEDKQEFPADLIPLMADFEGIGKCYVETANIDGETSLKLRQCAATHSNGGVKWRTPQDLAKEALAGDQNDRIRAQIEPPNPSIYGFDGLLFHQDVGSQRVHLGPSQMLLRGAVLRNTKFIYGLVAYTGAESKLVLNSRGAPSKLSVMERQVNRVIYFIFFVYFLIATFTTIARAVWNGDNESNLWYVCEPGAYQDSNNPLFADNCNESETFSDFAYWFTFIILFCNLIPISLYVTIEVINVVQALFVGFDAKMYDASIDMPAVARTSNMNSDLGQIEYIFSDKTGTLTCNEMKFRRCSVLGRIYGNLAGSVYEPGAPLSDLAQLTLAGFHDEDSRFATSFVEVLAVCHTVTIEEDEATQSITYQAESPDEEALVLGAKTLGWEYRFKRFESTYLRVDRQGKDIPYAVLATIEFDSTRKRMSVLIRLDNGQYKLLVKGADNVMIARAAKNGFVRVGGLKQLEEHLEMFAADGLRTLVMGERYLDERQATSFLGQWRDAVTSTDGRANLMQAAAEQVERDLTILGCTAIEDRLQDDVPQVIADLGAAGVKLWVLTGDKLTTAVHIGHSCKLLSKEMKKLVVAQPEDPTNGPSIKDQLDEAEKYIKDKHLHVLDVVRRTIAEETESSGLLHDFIEILSSGCAALFSSGSNIVEPANVGFVVDGGSLEIIFADPALRGKLLQITCCCKAVLACRVSPKQKERIVAMVKDGLKQTPVTLAIGDGANDVGMIQEAQIGVGISGKEGRQAVNTSDFAIAQFRFLRRLLLIHGRWNYRRMAKVIVYFFHKNIVITVIILFFTVNCAYSGQSIFEDTLYAGYNFFLGVAPFFLGFFDQDVSQKTVLKYLKVYSVGREQKDLNIRVMAWCFIKATYEGILIYYLFALSLGDTTVAWKQSGGTAGLLVWGTSVYTGMISAMLAKVALLFCTWNTWCIAGMVFSILFYLVFLLAYGSLPGVDSYNDVYTYYHVPFDMLDSGPMWLTAFLVTVAIGTFDVLEETVRKEFFFDASDNARENEAKRKLGRDNPSDRLMPSDTPNSSNKLRNETFDGISGL